MGEGGVMLRNVAGSVEGLEYEGISAQRLEKEDRHLLEVARISEAWEKVSIMNHVEAGKKHVADLLVSEKATKYEFIAF